MSATGLMLMKQTKLDTWLSQAQKLDAQTCDAQPPAVTAPAAAAKLCSCGNCTSVGHGYCLRCAKAPVHDLKWARAQSAAPPIAWSLAALMNTPRVFSSARR